MANVAPPGLNQFCDANGDPVANGKLYTYDAGTTTPRTTWSNAAESAANANPVILDSAGRAQIFYRGDYKLVLHTSADVLVWTVDGVSVPDNTITPQSILDDLADSTNASLGDALVAAKRSETGATATTLHAINQARPLYVPGDFPGLTYTQAWTNALASGTPVLEVTSSGIITAAMTVPAGMSIEGNGYTVTKGFNGDMFALGSTSVIRNLFLSGDGANFSGRGFLINTGTSDQRLLDCSVSNMAGYCLEYTAVNAGSRSLVTGGFWQRTTATNAAIGLPSGEALTDGTRSIENIYCGGGVLIDLNGGNMTTIHNCNTGGINFTSSSKQAKIGGGTRIATTTTTIDGSGHIIENTLSSTNIVINGTASFINMAGNNIAGTTTINAGAANVRIDSSNNIQGGITDNSGVVSNFIDFEWDVTPTWGADTVNPAIGNGSLTGRLVRTGRLMTLTVVLTMGGTTTYGTGPWFFQVPSPYNFNVKKQITGTVLGVDSSAGATGNFCGVCWTAATIAPKFYIAGGNAGAAYWGATAPITWASGDTLILTATWEIG